MLTQISDGLRLPIGDASSVVRRYPTTLTDEPQRHAQIMRGAVVGGSGAVNGGYFCRGLPSDFDGWGLPGWAWADVLPHFRAIETDLDFDNAAARLRRSDSGPAGCRIRRLHSIIRASGSRRRLRLDRRPQRFDAGGAVAVPASARYR